MEFEVVFQRQIADKMEAGFASLSDIVLKYGTEREVALFIEAAEEDGIRALLGFIVDRCGDSFDAILTKDKSSSAASPLSQSLLSFIRHEQDIMAGEAEETAAVVAAATTESK
ncbi:uncharacterized protein LOC144175942 isoform X2 [Haemaphysalis longicornis]